jgi:hypothetical protein
MMANKKATRLRRDLKLDRQIRWEYAVRETDAERAAIVDRGRAVLAGRRVARQLQGPLKAERERRDLSLADMMRLTGMSHESISRLENDPKPSPTGLPFARYAAALGLELLFRRSRAREWH